MRRRFFLLVVSTIVFGELPTPGLAADLALKTSPPPPLSWTGFYGGLHIGYGLGEKTLVDNFPTPDGEIDAQALLEGPLGGLQGGYNYQVNRLVLGVEGDFTWSNVKRRFGCFFFGDQVCSATSEWFGSIAGRLGFSAGPALLYLKGGIAWGHDQYTDLATCAGTQPRTRAGITAACGDTFYGSETRPGWLLGLGIEYLFAPNWSAKAEYNYLNFGSRSVPFLDGGSGFFTEEIHQQAHLLKLGLNYHFNVASTELVTARTNLGSDQDEDAGRVAVFSVADISKNSFAAAAGALIAPHNDLDTSGLRFYLLGESGIYKYPSDAGAIRGNYQAADALAGYAFEGDNYSASFFAGLNAIHHALSAIDPDNSVQGTRFGLKGRSDIWINPTPKTLTYAEAEYSTAFNTYSAKFKLGYDITKDSAVFAGPEVGVIGDQRYNQIRLGVHVTQVKFGKVELEVAAGYAHDSIVGEGGYGTVGLSTKF